VDPIEAYLSQQSDAGQRDSEGTFTISAERALDKLATHQLPRTSAWILKMVQAGVVAGASGMWVSHGVRSCEVRFKGGEFGRLDEIRAAWIEPTPISHRAQSHLAVALRAVAFARRRPVLIVHNCVQQGLRSLFWDGTNLARIGPTENRLWRVVEPGEIVFFISRSPLRTDQTLKKVHGVADVTAAEVKELTNYAVCSPVPLWSDSRRVNHFGMEDVSMIRRSLAFSAQQGDDGPSLGLPPSVTESCGLSKASLAWTLYHSAKREPSRVSWVKDGVVCEEETLHCQADSYQVRLFAPADDLETDLTALQLRFPSRDLRRRRTAQAVLGFCSELGGDSPLALKIGESQKTDVNAFVTASVIIIGGVVLAPLTSGISFLAGVGAAMGMAMKDAKTKSVASPKLRRFVCQLEQRYADHL
jgi:hypothetical protein